MSFDSRSILQPRLTTTQSRDRQIAIALGKPFQIRDVDCDVEPLTLDDFEDDYPTDAKFFVIEQARLATLCKSNLSILTCRRS